MQFLIISGMSGAGKSRCAGMLEDIGYYCVDNMPVALIPQFAELCLSAQGRYDKVALVTDIRERDNSTLALSDALSKMDKLDVGCRILFVDATTDVIIRRYKETRRRHPLAPDGANVAAAIENERVLLADLRERADFTIDTSDMPLSTLSQWLQERFSDVGDAAFTINFSSFGFKHGIPIDNDLMFDVRFLPNPFYIPELTKLTGEDAAVRDFVLDNDVTREFLSQLTAMLTFLLPQYKREGKHALNVSIGCTGGKHRSVAIAKYLADYFAAHDVETNCFHRDAWK